MKNKQNAGFPSFLACIFAILLIGGVTNGCDYDKDLKVGDQVSLCDPEKDRVLVWPTKGAFLDGFERESEFWKMYLPYNLCELLPVGTTVKVKGIEGGIVEIGTPKGHTGYVVRLHIRQ
jgi:hypothetical protein